MTNKVEEFINMIAPLIISEGKKRGYSVFSTVIAQAIIESNSGKSILGYKYHNYFGMKCGSRWKGKSVNLKTKEEYTVGTLTTIKDNFRVYDSIEEGVKGYYDFISTKRYANLKESKTYVEYAENLKADGYATSSKYVNTLCTTVDAHNLTKYDSFFNFNDEVIDNNNTDNTEYIEYTVKKGDSLWYIAERFYGRGDKYKIIYADNADNLKSTLIHIGDKLKIRKDV